MSFLLWSQDRAAYCIGEGVWSATGEEAFAGFWKWDAVEFEYQYQLMGYIQLQGTAIQPRSSISTTAQTEVKIDEL